MLTRITHLPVHAPKPHYACRLRESLSKVHNVAFDEYLGAHGCRAEICAVEGSADVALGKVRFHVAASVCIERKIKAK
jgi:hypothetical protein